MYFHVDYPDLNRLENQASSMITGIIDSLAHEGNSGGPLIDYQTGRICGVINGHFNPTGGGAVIQLGNRTLGTDSTITKAVSIEYAIVLIAEVLS